MYLATEMTDINRRLNAVWVRRSRAHIEKVKRQIALIDIPVDSVILETEFVELSETGSRNIGVDYGNGAGKKKASAKPAFSHNICSANYADCRFTAACLPF